MLCWRACVSSGPTYCNSRLAKHALRLKAIMCGRASQCRHHRKQLISSSDGRLFSQNFNTVMDKILYNVRIEKCCNWLWSAVLIIMDLEPHEHKTLLIFCKVSVGHLFWQFPCINDTCGLFLWCSCSHFFLSLSLSLSSPVYLLCFLKSTTRFWSRRHSLWEVDKETTQPCPTMWVTPTASSSSVWTMFKLLPISVGLL